MILYSLLHRELLSLPKKNFFYLKRTTLLIVMGIAFLMFSAYDNYASTRGLSMYSNMAYFLIVSSIVLAPASSLDVITREKQDRILELLSLTNISLLEIIVAKYFSRIFVVFLTYLSILPLILFYISFGGISGQQILASTAIILSFIFLGVAIGLLDSTFSSGKATGTLSIFTMTFYFIISSWLSDFVFLSPFGSMQAVLGGKDLISGYYNGLWQSLLAILIVLYAAKMLPKIYLHQMYGIPGGFLKKIIKIYYYLWRYIELNRYMRKRTKCEIEAIGHPVTWFDYYTIHDGDRKRRLQRTICFCILLCGLPLASYIFPIVRFVSISISIPYWGSVFMATTLIITWTLLIASWRSFISEKERNTLVFILATDISPEEIIKAKASAIYKTARPYYKLMAVSSFFLLLGSIGQNTPYVFCVVIVTLPLTIMSIRVLCSMAMWASLMAETIWKATVFTFAKASFYLLFIPIMFFQYFYFFVVVLLFFYLPKLESDYDKLIIDNLHRALE